MPKHDATPGNDPLFDRELLHNDADLVRNSIRRVAQFAKDRRDIDPVTELAIGIVCGSASRAIELSLAIAVERRSRLDEQGGTAGGTPSPPGGAG